MPSPRLRAAWALSVVACTLIALVSGTVFVIASAVGSGDDADTQARSTPQQQRDEPNWQRSIAWPVSVRRTADPRTAVVVYDVPSGRDDCTRAPAARVERETGDTVHVSVTYELGRMDCTLTRHDEISVSSRTELGDRDIVVNGESWAPARTAAYRRCADTACTPPAPPQCTDRGITAAVAATEAQGNRRTRSCTSRWLVVDVDARRWFFEYRDGSWRPLLGSRNPGCASVRTIAPAFPEAACEKLPDP